MRYCPIPHCCKKIESPAKHCPLHTRQRDARRGNAIARGYDSTWMKYSRAWLRKFPYCGMRIDGQLHAEHSRCVQRGVRQRAEVTDHIRSIRHGGSRFDPNNHQSLSNACNVAKG
jgi:5-methylcytosine-specific restriction endonuclease McrA